MTCREKSVAALQELMIATHIQVELKHWGFSLLPDGKCSGIFNFYLVSGFFSEGLFNFTFYQQVMSTSCQIATKNVPQGYPGQSRDMPWELVIWGFNDYNPRTWAVPLTLERAAAPLKEHAIFSSSAVTVLNLSPSSSWFQFKVSYHCFYAFEKR